MAEKQPWNKNAELSKTITHLILELEKKGFTPELHSFIDGGGVLTWHPTKDKRKEV